jgi:hypothetical protein
LKGLRKRDDRLALGLLTDSPFPEPELVIRNQIGADTYHCSASMVGLGMDQALRADDIQDLPLNILIQREILKKLRLMSIPTLVYTVNDPSLAQSLLEIDRISIFTDDVQALLPLMQVR